MTMTRKTLRIDESIRRYLARRPGQIIGPTEESVLEKAFRAAEISPEYSLQDAKEAFNRLGYSPVTKGNPDIKARVEWALILPS